MKKRVIFNVVIYFSLILLIGCVKSENNQITNPFNDIPIDSTKRIEFSNLIITSDEKELGRSKIVTDEIDIKTIGEYLKPINCISSNKKEKDPDFQISLIDNMDKEKNYLYSIGFSKNQIYIYDYTDENTNISVYEYTDTEVIEDLEKLYNDMDYEEELLMKK
ncbi:hypothetical protein R0131_06295 [Clostridium sp. AL.422]|uniref:hypothetical protein n=1 Tax=Clostridium TaxID=1485 RepID=UPI00293DA758|nr:MULTISPECIES: hypothetical protein [unclassified Clostridium]MDV4150441.1 hypothetical protein [Clostridium sp. AL.422]